MMMNDHWNKEKLLPIEQYVKEMMGFDYTGHDIYHAQRVQRQAQQLHLLLSQQLQSCSQCDIETLISLLFRYHQNEQQRWIQSLKSILYLQRLSLNILSLYKASLSLCPHDVQCGLQALTLEEWEYYRDVMAYLHDCIDDKFFKDEQKTEQLAKLRSFLQKETSFSSDVIDILLREMQQLSYHKNCEEKQALSLAAQFVQDADYLDALGAIGIARTFAYGSYHQQGLYSPDFSLYNGKRTSLQHFHDKLYHLDTVMNTQAAYTLAQERIDWMRQFEVQFLKEWEG